jgi:predicted protein tyrosine phosphatase
MHELIVRNRMTAQLFTSDRPWVAIQITNPDSDWPELSADQRVAVLQLRFPDRHSPDEQFRQGALFSEAQAQEILDFVQAHADRIDRLLVHCEQGTSRSTAVGAALTRVFLPGADWYQYFEQRSPNLLVYGRLLAEAQRRGLYQPPE